MDGHLDGLVPCRLGVVGRLGDTASPSAASAAACAGRASRVAARGWAIMSSWELCRLNLPAKPSLRCGEAGSSCTTTHRVTCLETIYRCTVVYSKMCRRRIRT